MNGPDPTWLFESEGFVYYNGTPWPYTNNDFNMTNVLCINNTPFPTQPFPRAADKNYAMFRIIVDVYIVGILVLVGFIGNSLSIAVLYRDHDKRNTTNWLLQTLAVVDTLYLIACFFFQTIKAIRDFTDWIPGLKEVFPYWERYIWASASIAQTITVWTVMLVTIDRYIAICKPLSTHLRSIERARIAVFVVSLIAIVYNIPRFFEREVIIEKDSCSGRLVLKSEKTIMRQRKEYFLIYKTIMFLVFRTIGPLLALIILNLKLISALREVRRKAKDMSRCRKHSENITLMLVVVVSVFIVCELPDLSLRICVTLYEFNMLVLEKTNLKYANSLTNMLLTVNSSINFLIYCLVGKKFRKILLEMYACGMRRGSNMPEISETEPLTMRSNIVSSKNGTASMKDGEGDVEVCLKEADGDVSL